MLKKERVVAYIDGFNLYFGLKDAGYHAYKWLDIKKIVTSLLRKNQTLIETKYFTSRVTNNPDKQRRQNIFLEAIETTGIKIYYGHYQTDGIECKRCGNLWAKYNEKMTDVNISTQMIIDAYNDKYDMAMLISGDSDLVPPIKSIHQNFKEKRVFVAFPPKRFNRSVSTVAKGHLIIGRKKISTCQLPLEIRKKDGYIISKPNKWNSKDL